MNMDNLLSVIINNLAPHFKTQTGVTAQLSLADFIPQGIEFKTGQNLILNLDGAGNIQLTDNSGQTITIPQSSLSLDKDISLNEPVMIQAKIGQVKNDNIRLQITEMNSQDPAGYLRSLDISSSSHIQEAAVTTKFSNPQDIPLQSVKVSELAQPFVQELPLTPQQQAQIKTALQQIEIKVQVNQMNFETRQTIAPSFSETSPVMQAITQNVNQLPEELALQPQNAEQVIQNAVNQVADNLRPLVGTKIPATTQENNFISELGLIQPEIALELPEAIASELEIIDILQTKPIQESTITSPLDKILNIIEQLKTDSPELYQKISAKLPSDNEQMLSNMVAFTKASAKGDVRQWLGTEIIQQLEQQGDKGQAVMNDLQNVLQSSHRQSPTWRMVEIPYYIENHIEKIKLAIKQYPEEEKEEDPHQKFGTRFVVDTNFTQLGAFQFDGFSFAKDRRFDLIIRTEREVGDDLCANIMRLFKTTLNEVQYTGNIKINLKENFIKISENNNEDKFLAQGLYI